MGPTRSPGTLPRPYSALQPPYCVSLTPKLPLALSPYSLFLPTSVSSISHSLLHSSYCIYLPLPLSLTESPTPFSFLPCSSSFPPTPSRHTPQPPHSLPPPVLLTSLLFPSPVFLHFLLLKLPPCSSSLSSTSTSSLVPSFHSFSSHSLSCTLPRHFTRPPNIATPFPSLLPCLSTFPAHLSPPYLPKPLPTLLDLFNYPLLYLSLAPMSLLSSHS